MAKVMLRVSKSGDPVKGDSGEEKMVLSTNKPKIDKDLDLRDRLSELIGKGNTLSPDDKASIYSNLVATLGKDKATKLMNHAFIFNSRPDMQKMPIEEKIKSFYTIGSSDPELTEIIGRTKNLGYGVVPGFRESTSQLNQELSGRVPVAETVAANPEIQRRVMLKIRK